MTYSASKAALDIITKFSAQGKNSLTFLIFPSQNN